MVRTLALALAVLLPVVPLGAAPQDDEAQIRARQRISMMEGTLERAVKNGADNLLRRVRTVVPDVPMLTGVPEVRGFRLEGYGVFFDVEVPALRLPVTWPLRFIVRDRDLEDMAAELRALLVRAPIEARLQEQLAQLARRLEMEARGPGASRTDGSALAASTQASPAAQAQAQVPAPAGDAAALLDDPAQGYTLEVKAALVDAMIENSGPLALEHDEWLTVAARDNLPRDPLAAGDTADFSTLIFRMKGSDLADFRAGRLTLEEARERVEVKEY